MVQAEKKDVLNSARWLLLRERYGILSTHSVEMAGYPFGSVTPYVFDRRGQVVILIANLAQHFKNITANPKVALTVLEGGNPAVQEKGRLTCLADAVRIESQDQDTRERYGRYFPETRDYEKTLGFMFFRLEAVRVRFIGGFGNINWIDPGDFIRPNPFSALEEQGILAHMNRDHQAALNHYGSHFLKLNIKKDEPLSMAGIDGEGFDLLISGCLYRIAFENPVCNLQEVRSVLTAMAKTV